MELIGRVLWWSERDENGILVDPHGNEFYFDRSVLKLRPKQQIKRNVVVTFYYNESISDCLCACKVTVPTASKLKSVQDKFQQQLAINI